MTSRAMASSGNAPTANNLLSPNAALEQVVGGKPPNQYLQQQQQQQQPQQRRKSTLSANGFFIDYSCTRRRSSAVREQQQQRDQAGRNQFISSYVNPVRWLAAGDKSGGASSSQHESASQQLATHYGTPSRLKPMSASNVNVPAGSGRVTRASYSAASGNSPVFQQPRANSFLVPAHLYAPAAMAGSRKTSIFDPAGHSIMAPHLNARRKSTMVTAPPVGMIEPASASNSTMVSVARKAAAAASRGSGGRRALKGELVRHVPVIGCSPTSIQASLSALEETKRYEKLLRRLKSHKERKEKRRRARDLQSFQVAQSSGDFIIDGCEFDDDYEDSGRFIHSKSAGLRRRSVKMMIRDAASLLNKRKSTQLKGSANLAEDNLDEFSITSIGRLTTSSARASLVSLDNYEDDELDNEQDGTNINNQGHQNKADRYEINNDELFVDENTLMNFNDLAANSGAELRASQRGWRIAGDEKPSNKMGSPAESSRKRSFVRAAIRKLSSSLATGANSSRQTASTCYNAASISPTLAGTTVNQAKYSPNLASRSMSVAGLNYHYYYNYLRENSIDAIDDLPIRGGGGGGGGTSASVGEQERRFQLHVNYSLARILILNSEDTGTIEAEFRKSSIAGGGGEANLARECTLRNLSDFSQSTDFLLTISTTSSGSSSSTSLASAFLDNHASASSSSIVSSSSSNGSTTTGVTSSAITGVPATKGGGAKRSAGSRRASDTTAADDECTSVDMEPCRLSVSVSPPVANYKTRRRQQMPGGGQVYGEADCRASLRPLAASAKRKSASGEVTRAGSWQASQVRQTNRHSHNNLVVASFRGDNSSSNSSSSSSSSSNNSDEQVSFANTATCLRNDDNVDADSDELDDFERLNRSHRGYKAPLPPEGTNNLQLHWADTPATTFSNDNNNNNNNNKTHLRPTKSLRCRNSSGGSSFRLAKRVSSYIIGRIGESTTTSKSNLREKRDISQSSGRLNAAAEINNGNVIAMSQTTTKAKRKGNSTRKSKRDSESRFKSSAGTRNSPMRPSGSSNRHNHHNQLIWPPAEHRYMEQRALLEPQGGRLSSAFNDDNNNNINNNDDGDDDKDNHATADDQSTWRRVCAQRDAPVYCNSHLRAARRSEAAYNNNNNNNDDDDDGDVPTTMPPCSARQNSCNRPTARGCGVRQTTTGGQYDWQALLSAREGIRTARSQSSLINLGCLAANDLQIQRTTTTTTTSSNSTLWPPNYEFRQQQQHQQHNLPKQMSTGTTTCKSRRCHSATLTQPPLQHPNELQASEGVWQVWGSCNDIIIIGDPSEDVCQSGCSRCDGTQDQLACQVCANLELAQPVNDRRLHAKEEDDDHDEEEAPAEEEVEVEVEMELELEEEARISCELRRTQVPVDNQLATSSLNNPVVFLNQQQQQQTSWHELTRARAHSSGGAGGRAQVVARSAAATKATLRHEQHWQPTPEISARCRQNPPETHSGYLDRSERPQHLVGSLKQAEHHLSSSTLGRKSRIQSEQGLSGNNHAGFSASASKEYPHQNASVSSLGCGKVEEDAGANTNTSGQAAAAAASDDEQIKIDLLKKSSFTCMLVGARRTGKRSIVKCFVKLLNEFKLALEEYKKEKMLAKLMDCSERLQALSYQQEELRLQALSDQQLDRRPSNYEQGGKSPHQRARGNSWLSGSPVDRWFRLPSMGNIGVGSKRRLNSMVAYGGQPRLMVSDSGDSSNQQHQQQLQQQQQQRRHTTIEHECMLEQDPFEVRQDRFLTVDSRRQIDRLTSACNKSDFDINYQGVSKSRESIALQRLHLNVPSKSLSGQAADECRNSAKDSGGTCTPVAGLRDNLGRSMQYLSPTPPTPTDLSNNKQVNNQREPTRNQSIQINGRRKPLLSLKELNKRRIRIKFNTRRQLSDKYTQIISSQQQRSHNVKQNSNMRSNNETDGCLVEFDLPDSYMVVYSVNDRESFDYAKLLISQLRSIKRQTPLPIFLVANKIDLERAKVIKSEEGRMLAKEFACKFMETSCTVGFNLDNLLVGLRTQLILKHHITINSILRYGKSALSKGAKDRQDRAVDKSKGADNILVRFYKRYLINNDELNYECDNFSKL